VDAPGERREDMKIDTELKKEITRAAKSTDYRKNLRAASEDLKNRYGWDDAFKKYGRAIVSICSAASILDLEYEYDKLYRDWARAIFSMLDSKERIRAEWNGTFYLHPAIVQDNLYSFIKLVNVE